MGNLGVVLFPDLMKSILKVPQPAHFRMFESGLLWHHTQPSMCWLRSAHIIQLAQAALELVKYKSLFVLHPIT